MSGTKRGETLEETESKIVVYTQVASARNTSWLSGWAGATAAIAIRDRTVLDRRILASLPQLRLIASTGPHRVDIQAATELGIVVAGTPGTSTASVAEHVEMVVRLQAEVTPASATMGCYMGCVKGNLSGKEMGSDFHF
jgi:D-3-phosphoglycerate dehydrogenase / 2-oxoglutarate reductase